MSHASSPPSLLIASHDIAEANALAELLRGMRPELSSTAWTHAKTSADVDVVLVIEALDELAGQLAIRVRNSQPDAAIVLIAPRFDQAMLAVAAAVAAVAIVPSPCEQAVLARVLEQLQHHGRFAGRCGGVRTAELLGLYAMVASTGVLHLEADGRSGSIQLEHGRPVYAACGQQLGIVALRELLDWPDARATWVAGRSGSAANIFTQVEGLPEPRPEPARTDAEAIHEAPHELIDRIENLAEHEDILGAYLLRNTEVVFGRNVASLDSELTGRALSGLAQVYLDMEDQQGERVSSEIQAMVGEHRLVVDRVGPASSGYQVGVVVRQAAPICKSLRRLLRQLDRTFRRALNERARAPVTPRQASAHARAVLNRVA